MNRDPNQSTRPCGCDPGANHVCDTCQKIRETGRHDTDVVSGRVDTPGGTYYATPLGHGQRLVQREQALKDTVPAREWKPSRYGPTRPSNLPADPAERKKYPIMTGVLRYFPDAIVEIARVSWEGNNQHNPGQPLHWDRAKSMDQEDTELRHRMEAGTRDSDGQRHSAKAAWRAMAELQLEIERERETGQ